RSLARFQLKGIPPMTAGMARLEVTFLIDADGILSVTAREATTGKEASVQVKPSYGLTDDQIEQMLLDSYEHAEDDLKSRVRIEASVEAERILDAIKVALATDGGLLAPDERAAIDGATAALAAATAEVRAGTGDHRKVRDLIAQLDAVSKP